MSEMKLPNQVYRLRQADFGAIPGSPWVYWVSKNVQQIFSSCQPLLAVAEFKQGLATLTPRVMKNGSQETSTKSRKRKA